MKYFVTNYFGFACLTTQYCINVISSPIASIRLMSGEDYFFFYLSNARRNSLLPIAVCRPYSATIAPK